MVHLITLDPGHFHAALVQKTMYPDVDSTVHVYAPDTPDLTLHLQRIADYNNRTDEPTHWNEVIYKGPGYLDRMISEHAGNVVVISGNNQQKSDYILRSLKAGFNVLADKPMVISPEGFNQLVEAFDVAKKNHLLLYDIMTERYEITTMLQRMLSMDKDLFGTLQTGSPGHPAITKESVHHLFKTVSGNVLTRPAWYLDVTQQGEGIVDVTTHLVDLIQWECFPDQAIDYKKDIELLSARHWTTPVSHAEFTALTHVDDFPDYLKGELKNDTLQVYCNGEINYKLKNIYAKVSVTWAYAAPEGTGDTHYSLMHGTHADLIIRQGAEQQYKPTLYIESAPDLTISSASIQAAQDSIDAEYPGVTIDKDSKGWVVHIPDKYAEGHEAHFARVTRKYLSWLKDNDMPDWEVPNMLAKYYLTTQALQMARKSDPVSQ